MKKILNLAMKIITELSKVQIVNILVKNKSEKKKVIFFLSKL